MSEPPNQDHEAVLKERRRMISEQLQRSDDFGFELRTKGVLEAAGGRVTHGWTYLDPVEEKPRQFDLRASFSSDSRHMSIAVECKNLDPAAPLVISGTRRTRAEAFYDFVQADRTHGLRQRIMRVQADCDLYRRDEFVGKSLLRLKPEDKRNQTNLVPASDKESDIFGRWSQALASAAGLCRDAAIIGANSQKVHTTLILPVVVVPDGSLWTVEYNKDGSIFEGPNMANAATFFVNHPVTVVEKRLWTNLTHVHFLTLTGLREFLAHHYGFPPSDWFPSTAEPHQPPLP